MHDYELMTILNPDIGDEDVNGTLERINQFITARGGEIQNVDTWGRRKLAYPIARQVEGTYSVTLLRLPPTQAAELEANLRISEDVLRHLLVRYSPAEAAAALTASQRRRPRQRADDAAEGEGSEADEPAEVTEAAGTADPAPAENMAAEEPEQAETITENAEEETPGI